MHNYTVRITVSSTRCIEGDASDLYEALQTVHEVERFITLLVHPNNKTLLVQRLISFKFK